MNFQRFYTKFIGTFFLISIGASAVFAQTDSTLVVGRDDRPTTLAGKNNLYCAGFVQTSPVNTANKIVGAENEQDGYVYATGDNLYISMGASKGVQVGDMFAVIRPRGRVETRWTRKDNLGFFVQEVGALEVIKVKADVSVVRVKFSCDNLLLGDLLQAVPTRTSPLAQQRPVLDLFAEPTGKSSGRIFMARDGQEMLGTEQIVYLDLGAEDNVQVGDYLTVFRPLGKGNLHQTVWKESVAARDEGFQSDEYRGGKFSNQAARKTGETARGKVETTQAVKKDRPKNLRKIVGEVVILNVKERTATAMIVRTAQEIHTGDYVELQ